jgi:transcriptional regulator with XRE-family HTH domain
MELRIKELREGKDWNQTALAYHAGITASQVSLIETGKRNPSVSTLEAIAKAMEVEVADLFPKAQAPLSFGDIIEAGEQSILDVPYEVFWGAMATTKSDEEFLSAFKIADAQRVSRELKHLEDEANREARAAYARAVDRRIILSLALLERGIRRPDPEGDSLSRQVEKLERVLQDAPTTLIVWDTSPETQPETQQHRSEIA